MFSALALRDLLEPRSYRYGVVPQLYSDFYDEPHVHLNIIRPRRQQSSSSCAETESDPSKFEVLLNVKHFSPDEIDVKTVDNFVVIHGKHEEHADEHGFVSREFTRRYQLPDDVVPEKVTSSLTQDGILKIQAPRKVTALPKNERVVPITIQQPVAVENASKMEVDQQAAAAAGDQEK